jgi:hypothetical protein
VRPVSLIFERKYRVKAQKYMHKNPTPMSDMVEAVRYGDENGRWHADAVAEIAQFVLGGLDVEAGVTLENERIMDVVKPVEQRWNPDKNEADLDMVDPFTGNLIPLKLGQWIIRDRFGHIWLDEDSHFTDVYYPVALIADEAQAELNIVNELAALIYDHFPWEGATYEAVAETVAAEIIKAGWAKKEKP